MDEPFDHAPPVALVVEDDPLLLMDAMDLAEEVGIMAYGARNASAALSILEQHEAISVLFTDIQMPGDLDGLALAHVVRNRWPNVAILITSGHCNVTEADMPEGGRFIAKPYSPAQIVRLIGELVQKPRTSG